MTLKLLRTDLQSEWQPILIAAAVSFALWIICIGIPMPGYTTPAAMTLGMLPFAMLIFVLGAKRGLQQRRRLLAQLPVTGTAIRIASWLSYFTIVAIACLIGVAILLVSPPAPEWGWVGFAMDAGRTVVVFTCWVALWRVFGLGTSLRPPFNYIVMVATVCIFLILWIAAVALAGSKVPSHDDVTVSWTLFFQVTASIALALILLDILLARFAGSCAC